MAPAIIAALMGGSLLVPWDSMTLPQREYATAQLIDSYGDKYKLTDGDKLQMYKTVACESAGTFKTILKSGFAREESYGMVQINTPSHPGVSKADAQDPDFAIDFMAAHFADHDKRIWTCWRNLYG